jgi:hypothetical protein
LFEGVINEIGFETVIDAATEVAAACVREEVFDEWQLAFTQLPPYDDGHTLTTPEGPTRTN